MFCTETSSPCASNLKINSLDPRATNGNKTTLSIPFSGKPSENAEDIAVAEGNLTYGKGCSDGKII